MQSLVGPSAGGAYLVSGEPSGKQLNPSDWWASHERDQSMGSSLRTVGTLAARPPQARSRPAWRRGMVVPQSTGSAGDVENLRRAYARLPIMH